MTKLIALWDRLRGSLWFIPTLMLGLSIVLSNGMLMLDEHLKDRLQHTSRLLYSGGPEGARALLSSVAGSMITVAGVAFSVTVVALTLASQQYGPRLLRNFMRDRGNQIVLGTFIATFIYCLLVLRDVRGTDQSGVVPHASVTVGLILAILSLGVLIYFIHHVTNSIRASTIVAAVGRDLEDAIERLFPSRIGTGPKHGDPGPSELPKDLDRRSASVAAPVTGYLQAIDSDTMMNMAVSYDLILKIPLRPGYFLHKGDMLAQGWPQERMTDSAMQEIQESFVFGNERTFIQDIEFTINQLVEVAVRALSPGTNDPFTAIASIDRLGVALCRLARRTFPSPYRYDQDGRLRIITAPLTLHGIIEAAFNQIRQYGRGSAAVTIRLIDTIERIAEFIHTEEAREALLNQATMIERGSHTGLHEEWDRQVVYHRYTDVVHKLMERKALVSPLEGR